jgi:uncharacterized protein
MLGDLTPREVEEMLHAEVVARVGCYGAGRPYVVPITYAYDGESIVSHSRDGLKIRTMRDNPLVCVEVDRVDDMSNWQSVIAWGRYEELTGAAAVAALEQLVVRLAPLGAGETSTPPHWAQGDQADAATNVVVYRIRLTEKTGRFERP